jgi:serine phosphatase RsbU (regulator of sigma subunit)/anti-sigma regulatory factor (Ser/Thr protein kinase)
MKAWWNRLSLHNKLQIPIQLALLVMLLIVQIWVTDEFKRELFDNAQHRAINSATQAFWGLNSMMLNGNIGQPDARKVYFKKMAGLDGVQDFHLVRGRAVQDQFGIGLPEEQARDELDLSALASNQIQIKYLGQHKLALREPSLEALRVVVPFAASHDFHGTDCLRCHHVPEGAVNGAVSMTISLAKEHVELVKIRTLFTVGQILLQIALFFLIRSFIHKAILPVIKLEKTMLAIEVDGNLNKRVQIETEDEVGHIAQVFNTFLQHIAELKQRLANKVAVLEKYHTRTEEEQRVGSFIMSRMTQLPPQLETTVQRYMKPVEHLSGDILIAAESPDGTVYLLLADAVGHGLSAAVNVLPLCQTFYDLAEKGFSIGHLSGNLNQLVNKFMPADRFVSAALVTIHPSTRVIEVWNGGIPPLLLFSRQGKILHRWTSDNLPLGILPNGEFSAKIEAFHYQDDCQLCLFSDGLAEAVSPSGMAFGEARVIELLGKTDYAKRSQTLISAIEKHLGGTPAHDDISLAIVDIRHRPDPEKIAADTHLHKNGNNGNDWRIAISLGAAELKYLDIVPLLTQIIAKISATSEHHSALYMILSELFNNALDHGLLKLDSALKLEPDGFDRYLEMRADRLRSLQSGKIEMEVKPLTLDGLPAVEIRVTDSGGGFDHSRFTRSAPDSKEDIPFGRGIALVKSVAHKLTYSEHGNEVVASYLCA